MRAYYDGVRENPTLSFLAKNFKTHEHSKRMVFITLRVLLIGGYSYCLIVLPLSKFGKNCEIHGFPSVFIPVRGRGYNQERT